MTAEITWYLARTSGLLAWILLAVATLWGLLLSSRLLERRPSPAWLLDLHRHLGTLTLTLTVLHLGAIVVDDFVEFTLVEVVVPFTSDLDRGAVALGVLAGWLLVVVQTTSWARAHMSLRLWRVLHYSSAPAFAMASAHGWLIGTDIGNPVVIVVASTLIAEVVFVVALRLRFGRRPTPARA